MSRPDERQKRVVADLRKLLRDVQSKCDCEELDEDGFQGEHGYMESDPQSSKINLYRSTSTLYSDINNSPSREYGPFGDDRLKLNLKPSIEWVPDYNENIEPDKHPLLPIPRPPPIVELRNSDIHKNCDCLKRNGLQHDCPLSGCQGLRECLIWPIPVCIPSGLGKPRPITPRVKRAEMTKFVFQQKKQKMAPIIHITAKDIERQRLQDEAEAELRQKVASEIIDKTTCKRVDCFYKKVGPKRNVKSQTEVIRDSPTEIGETDYCDEIFE